MTTDAYQPPAIVDLPEPLPAAALAQLRADVAFNEAAAEAAFARLLGGAQARATRVRVLRGGFKDYEGRITGVSHTGAHIITTDSGLTLVYDESNIERIAAE